MNTATSPSVLVAGIPRRHLASAVKTCRANGRVVLPAGNPGDLDEASPGMDVLLMIVGTDETPAATWRATFVQRVDPGPDAIPELVPPTWVEEHGSRVSTGSARVADPDDDEDDKAKGAQSYFEVQRLEELPKHAWVFANEFVRKQERGGRVFFPRGPRLIQTPA